MNSSPTIKIPIFLVSNMVIPPQSAVMANAQASPRKMPKLESAAEANGEGGDSQVCKHSRVNIPFNHTALIYYCFRPASLDPEVLKSRTMTYIGWYGKIV